MRKFSLTRFHDVHDDEVYLYLSLFFLSSSLIWIYALFSEFLRYCSSCSCRLLYKFSIIAVSSRQCASTSPGASSPPSGLSPPLPPPLCLRYSRFEPNTFDPSGPVTLIAFVFSPSVASTSYSTFSLYSCIRLMRAKVCQFLVLTEIKKKKNATAANNKTTLLGGFLLSFPLRSRGE